MEERGGGNQRLTDPRAGVRFRFNVSLHVQRGEALGVGGTRVRKGVGLAGGPHDCDPLSACKAPDVTHRNWQA